MFFDILDDLYLFLVKNKDMTFFKMFVLSLKIFWNLILAMFLTSVPYIVFYYLTK